MCAVFAVFKQDFAPFLNVSRETMRENPQKTPKTHERPTRDPRETYEKHKRKTREFQKQTRKDKARGVFCALGAEKSTICLSLHLPSWIRFGFLEQKNEYCFT